MRLCGYVDLHTQITLSPGTLLRRTTLTPHALS